MAADKEILTNRQAFHEYHILDKYEAGAVLVGTEVKSIMEGRIQLKDSYVQVKDGETVQVVLGGAGVLELHGRVSRDGAPLARAEVAGAPASGNILSAREARADDQGRFALIGLRAGRVLFRVHERSAGRTWFAAADFHGAKDEEVVLVAPDSALEIALGEGARVRARLEAAHARR